MSIENQNKDKNLTPEEVKELDAFLEVPGSNHYMDINFSTVSRYVVGFGVNGMHFRMLSTGKGKVHNSKLGIDLEQDLNEDQLSSVRRGAFMACIISKKMIKVITIHEFTEEEKEQDVDVWVLQFVHANGTINVPCPDRKLALYYRSYFWSWIHGTTGY